MNNFVERVFSYDFKDKTYDYTIRVNIAKFTPGVDSLYYIGTEDEDIAQIVINDYKICLKAIGTCKLIDEQEGIIFDNEIPKDFLPLLDINAEFNLQGINVSVLERNHFEYLICKNVNGVIEESSIEFHKIFYTLDSSLQSFFSELNTVAISFLQGDFSEHLESEFEEDFEIPELAFDDFESLLIECEDE